MRTFLLALACLAHHAQARMAQKSVDDQDYARKIATLLLSLDPSAAITATGSGATLSTKSASVVQGGSLKTWSYRSIAVDRVQVVLTTDGRPLDANVELWQGPDNTPAKMRVYSEDGAKRPFSAVIATPEGSASTVCVRNVGQIVFPLAAYVSASQVDEAIANFVDTSMIIQGGALRTYEFSTSVENVEITLKTDGRPLNARVELLEGPNNIKQVIELYTEDGLERPFFAIVDTKGNGNVVRIVNTAPMEFPLFASVEPHNMHVNRASMDPIMVGGDSKTDTTGLLESRDSGIRKSRLKSIVTRNTPLTATDLKTLLTRNIGENGRLGRASNGVAQAMSKVGIGVTEGITKVLRN